ncbi:MAG: hypothetical protein KGJ02_03290 [Verrucomicrobiota bacterium]|nr:hypothetical protein [Verrucomicrobiota bacterium]
MWSQTFDPTDLVRLITLAFLEILLSADNAVVLSLLTRALPTHLRHKALIIGVWSAFLLRAAALFAVSLLISYPWIPLLGALYLIYLAAAYFLKPKKERSIAPVASFWKTVILIELFDLAFAIDSIIAGVAFVTAGYPSSSLIHPKLWIVYIGGMLGLLFIRYAASLFSSLIGKFPHLETSAHLMIGWIGVKLAFSTLFPSLAEPLETFFWAVLALLFARGLLRR